MFFLKYSAFKNKYYTKSPKKLDKIMRSEKWIVVDIRPKGDFEESHIIDSINIPYNTFKLTYPKQIKSNKKILLVSTAGHSHLDLYHLLKKHNLKVYLLEDGWNGIHNKAEYDHLVTYFVLI